MSVFESDWQKDLSKWKIQKQKYKNQPQNFEFNNKVPPNVNPVKYNPLPTIKEKKLNSKVKIIIFLIPALIFLYLIYNNIMASHEFIYFYDIGGDNYLSPKQRISDTVYLENSSYRDIKQNLVYFSVPFARGSSKVVIRTKFKDNFPQKSVFSLGAKDQPNWHYKWNVIYNSVLSNLQEFTDENGMYKVNKDLDDYTIEELIQGSGFVIAASKDFKESPVKGEDYIGESIINYSLRGGHIFYIYAANNISLEVQKQDLNWYNGSDELEISLLNSEGELKGNLTIEDDGILEVNKAKGNMQEGKLEISNLSEGVYRLEFSDFDGLIREIKINTKKIVAFERVYLADSSIFNLE